MLQQFLDLLEKYQPWQKKGLIEFQQAAFVYIELTSEEKEKAWRAHNKHCGKELAITTVENFSEKMKNVRAWYLN